MMMVVRGEGNGIDTDSDYCNDKINESESGWWK